MSISTTDATNVGSVLNMDPKNNQNSQNSLGATIVRNGGIPIMKPLQLNGNNGTFTVNVFQINGIVKIIGLYANVSGPLGNCTNVFLDLWDGGGAIPVTANPGTNLSGAPQNSFILKSGNNTEPIKYKTSGTGIFVEDGLKGFFVGQKNGSPTFIRMTYTTIDTPTSGQIDWIAVFIPHSNGSCVMPA